MKLLVLFSVFAAPCLFAQGRSSILGAITDETGAAIAKATVTVLNTGTQQKWTTTSGETGLYEVPALEIGTYEVSAEVSGFRKTTVRGIVLQVDQRERVDMKLQVGELTQQVEVEAQALSVNTDDATLSTVIDSAKIRELPLPGNRNLFRLALLAPGMSRGPASSVTTSGFGPGFGIAAMGQKVQNNAIYLDGAPLRTSIHGAVRMRPSVEAIEEFRVEAGWYSAEYGTQSGAQIVATIRPGTNDFHGTAFEFLRNDVLDAHNFFDPPGSAKTPLRRNTFGGVISGPVWIPKIYNGKNKTFFTFNAELYRERRSTQGFAIYPSDRMRRGDLTEKFFRRADGSLIPIMDLDAKAPFPGNQIPNSRISPIALKLAQFWPSPNMAQAEFDGTNNYSGVSRNRDNDDQYFVRGDHNFNDKNRLFGRYGIQTVELPVFPINPNPFFVNRRPRRQQNATLNYTRMLTPTWLNVFRVSYNRDIFKTNDDVSGTSFNILRDLGIPGQTNVPSDTGLPSIGLGGIISGLGTTDINTIWDESRQASEQITFTRGKHSVKIGTEYTMLRLDRRTISFVRGAFDFTGIHSGTAPGVAGNERGRLAWADFLLDEPQQVRLGFTDKLPPGADPGTFPRSRFWRWHTYITDDIKLTSRLTMNIGVRYEYNSSIEDIGGQSRNFDFTKQDLVPAVLTRGPLNDPSKKLFAPRIGFAWRPFGGNSTVIRTGYGIFYNVNMMNMFIPALAANPPNNLNVNELNTAGVVRIRMRNADQASALNINSEINSADTKRGVGDVQQWNFNIQRMLPKSMLLEVGYMGSKSSHFDSPRTVNPYVPGTTRRVYPGWGPIENISLDAAGTYHGLLTKFEKRMSQGITFLQTYTWSKTMFDSFACCGAQRHNDPYNWRLEKGLGETDQRHRATTAFLWELPFYRGKRDFRGQALGGWQFNGALSLETGLPMHPSQSVSPIDDGCPRCNRRPDRLADGNLDSSQRTLQRWFDTSAFVLARGHYGNSGRNILTAPGLTSLDFAVFKNFLVGERKEIQFRWENYNFTNTPPFNPPTLEISSGNFGRITSAGLGREMQFGLRFQF
ncbi:MAG: TonB-dependent receptor [Bryobacterales bacterium]|nr:TonB-dependent receptor [Bryobacterales bacterium]